MGVFLKFVFFSLLFSWLLNQLVAPFLDGYQQNKAKKSNSKTKPEPPKEVIKYRKIDPEDGEYVDYEDIK